MKRKKDLLLLHGALGSQAQFEHLKKRLAPHFCVHVFNFSGHGGNSTDQEFTMDVFLKDVLRFMSDKALQSTSVFGYSMGGYVALKLAMKYPGKVEKVMTLGTKIQWNAETAEKEVRLLDPKKMREKIPRFVALLKEEHAPGDWKKLVLKTAAMLHGLGNGKAIDLKCFTRLETSVLVCLGSEDTMVSKIESEELVDNLDKGRFLEIQGFKHPIGQVDQSHLSDIMLTYFTEE